MRKKHIAFLFSARDTVPAGDHKVIYEYANRLVNDGFDVTLIYPDDLNFKKSSFFRKSIRVVKYGYVKLSGIYKSRWFPLDSRIRLKWVISFYPSTMSAFDVIVATSWETADFLRKYDALPDERKLHFIQGIENHSVDEETVSEIWQSSLRKIVAAPWLQAAAADSGAHAELIESGFDFKEFYTKRTPEDRDKYHVAMLYHMDAVKGSEDGLEAVKIVKEAYPQLTVSFVGTNHPPEELPDWIDYYLKPSKMIHNSLYNRAAIFVAPEISETWGLPVGEAMLCSCAVACADNKGYRLIAKHGETALLSPVCNPEKLAESIIRLIEDDDLRYRLAKKGHQEIQAYSWDKAYAKFRSFLEMC